MKTSKKIFTVCTLAIIAILSMFTLTGCGSEEPATNTAPAPAATNTASTQQTQNNDSTGSNVIQVNMTVINQYPNATLTALYLSGAGQENWGSELLGGQTMPTGTQIPLVFNIDKNNVKWDMKATDENGQDVEFRNIDLSNVSTSGGTITLTAGEDGTPYAVAQ